MNNTRNTHEHDMSGRGLQQIRHLLAWTACAAAILATGCASGGYDRITLGRQASDFQRVFPEGKVRQTENTVCFIERDYVGRTDAVILLLTPDRQVCGKLHASNFHRNYGLGVGKGYRLRGVIDPELAGYGGAGPIDLLRVIADDLTGIRNEGLAREAHNWVAAGVVRLVQHWPHTGDAGPARQRLRGILDLIPTDGTATIEIDPRSVVHVRYVEGSTR